MHVYVYVHTCICILVYLDRSLTLWRRRRRRPAGITGYLAIGDSVGSDILVEFDNGGNLNKWVLWVVYVMYVL